VLGDYFIVCIVGVQMAAILDNNSKKAKPEGRLSQALVTQSQVKTSLAYPYLSLPAPC
jgi:hypothetical protein